MYGYGGYPIYFDWTYLLAILGLVLTMIASGQVRKAHLPGTRR